MNERTKALIDTFASISHPEEFALSPDGSKVVFTLDVNGHQQIFTLPTSFPAWPQRVTATLADCINPQWSPDGKQIAFVSETALWTVNSDGTHCQVLTDHPSGNSEPRWSPDGSRIAFFSRRRGWEHIWSIPAGGGKPFQILKGEYDGDDLVWSPDSSSLAFCSIREDDLMTRGVYCVPADGGKEELISPRGCWSGAPSFSPDGRHLAYLSDYDGWFHIYLYDFETGSTRQLTDGECEDGGPYFYNVDRFSGPMFSPDGKMIAYTTHRQGNFDVWVVFVEDGRVCRVSRSDGHYRLVGWMPDLRHLAVTFDDIARPPDLQILSLDGQVSQITNSRTGPLDSDDMITPEWITYQARDGLTIHGALFVPKGITSKETAKQPERRPAVLFLHGGPNFEFGNYYYPLPELVAQEGFVVLAPNFRGSTGYGTRFRHSNFHEWGHADAMDVVDGALWLKNQPFVDPERIAVMGPSYGGYLTLSAVTLAPELFCAGVDLYGDSEIAESYRHGDRYGRMDLARQMGKPEQYEAEYRRGSPFYLAERIQAPLLILHGKDDRLVVPLMSEKMIEALRIENKYFESHFYKGEEHGFAKPENKRDAWTRILAFLNRHCKGEEPAG